MSFTTDVKEELYPVIDKGRNAQIAELCAIVGTSCVLSAKEDAPEVRFVSDNENLCRKYFTLLHKTISIDKNDKTQAGEEARRLLKVLKIPVPVDGKSTGVNGILLQQESAKAAFLRGIFLCTGTISDPKKSYHFEVSASDGMMEAVMETLRFFEAEPKQSVRKGKGICYVKDSTQIVELLGRMGAHRALLEFENARIYNGMRGNVNRRVNCETANIKKTVNSAVHQIACIQRIEDEIGLLALPESLREMAVVRIEHPEEPLGTLGSFLDPPIGKSGVNHRLRRIVEIAEKL